MRQSAYFLVLVGFVWIPACSDDPKTLTGEPGDACRQGAECQPDLVCLGVNYSVGCGIPPRELCALDTDCPMGNVCHAILDSCSSDGLGSLCAPPCPMTTCESGLRCGPNGACEPIPCNDGFTCPARQQCDPSLAYPPLPVASRASGCIDIPCVGDNDCPTGKPCVNQTCQDGLGQCQEPPPIPP